LTADELIESIVERYYEEDLPEDPDQRLASLRDVVVATWGAFSASDRVALAAELDDAEDVVGFAGAEPELSPHELRELDEQAIDGLVDRARQEIPELAVSDDNQP
jgi:hypothetical protein